VWAFAMTRQSYQAAQYWAQTHHLTHPVVHDPPPSTYYWMYSHGYIPQNTLTDRNFVVIYDAIGYYQTAIINAIEAHLSDISVVLPDETPIVVPGGGLEFDVTLKNWGTQAHTFHAWLDGIFPDHTPVPINPLMGPVVVTLQPGQEVTRTVTLHVPGAAPPGDNYRLKVSVGRWPDDIHNCDLMRFDIFAP
jgi:hypothetical protein